MKNTLISETEAFELAHGRVPGRPDLDQLADLLTEYRSAAIGLAPRPSAELAARLDLSATPIVMQRDAVADGETTGVGVRRTVSGLFGLIVTGTLIVGAASGAAAAVGAGSAGLLPPGAQDAFNQVVSLVVPPGVVGLETSGEGEAPGDRTGNTSKTSGGSSDDATEGDSLDPAKQGKDNGNANHGTSGKGEPQNAGNGNSENSNGRAGDSGSVTTDEATTPGNSGNGNGNSETNNGSSGNGNSGNGNGNSGTGNGNSDNGNSGNGNGKKP